MKKYIAQIIIETTSPLVVGAGKPSIDSSSIIAKDFNFLPYIPATGIAGILSQLFEEKYGEKERKEIFGGEDDIYEKDRLKEKPEGETLRGSYFETCDALLLDNKAKVLQSVLHKDELSPFYKKFLALPKREHVKIGHDGIVDDLGGKFDNEFVFKGARFKFELEFMSDINKEEYWKFILNSFYSKDFLLGSGTANGYGQSKVISLKTKTYDLSNRKELEAYLDHTVDLNTEFDGTEFVPITLDEKYKEIHSVKLTTNAIHIGAGYGDHEVNDTNYKEFAISWNKENQPEWKSYFVIPGSSIKGILAHRVAYYHNLETNKIVENIILDVSKVEKTKIDILYKKLENDLDEIMNSTLSPIIKKEQLNNLKDGLGYESYKINYKKIFEDYIGENNLSVKELFGSASNDDNIGSMGKIIIDDIYIPFNKELETIFEHNSIDRYTGGTIDTALFSEKVFTPNLPLILRIKTSDKENIRLDVLNRAINDLINGNLAIGGKTNKGYGILLEQK